MMVNVPPAVPIPLPAWRCCTTVGVPCFQLVSLRNLGLSKSILKFSMDFNIFFQGFQGILLDCSTQASSHSVLDCLRTFLSYERLLYTEFRKQKLSFDLKNKIYFSRFFCVVHLPKLDINVPNFPGFQRILN
jgi:hypothetical protein